MLKLCGFRHADDPLFLSTQLNFIPAQLERSSAAFGFGPSVRIFKTPLVSHVVPGFFSPPLETLPNIVHWICIL